MAGIYVHIPFCRKACHYCDFHFSTSTRSMQAMAHSIAEELRLRKTELKSMPVQTLYFGGGTPSLMPPPLLHSIRQAVEAHYTLDSNLECTIEVNPDDMPRAKLEAFKNLGFNRLSVGIQSFDDNTLQWMNRSHRADQALQCVSDARNAGFDRISIDLMYGLPMMSHAAWQTALQKAISLDVEHISAYCLTVEEKTVLGHRVRKGAEKPVDEEAALKQFEVMVELLSRAGFEQYELSNFAKAGHRSRHNSAYWHGSAYLGVGPSAHSLTMGKRSWNVANNAAYIKSLSKGELLLTEEHLTNHDRYNEWVMTGLRTSEGIDLQEAQRLFGVSIGDVFADRLSKLRSEGHASLESGRLKLTTQGLFLADGIAADLFILDE